MFNKSPTAIVDKQFFLPWLEEGVLASRFMVEAKRLLDQASALTPELARLRLTPQTPPHHAEGARVEAHLLRIMATLLAISEREDLLFIEEIAREKTFVLEIKALVKLLSTHKDFFLAYACAHDLGKAICLTFDAVPGTKGEAEGFAQSNGRVSKEATESERQRFDKLFRAFAASHSDLADHKLVAAFFDATGIVAHYLGHDRVGASAALAPAREQILSLFKISRSHHKMLTELIRLHMDILTAFERGSDVQAYKSFNAIAGKLGLNKELFLDLALGAMFLDGVVGSLKYENGAFAASFASLFNFLAAEREAAPERHLLREEVEKRLAKAQVKAVLEAGGLSPEAVFELLGTPIGPIRGQVMQQVYELIRDPASTVDFGAATEELRRRAVKTREIAQERGVEI